MFDDHSKSSVPAGTGGSVPEMRLFCIKSKVRLESEARKAGSVPEMELFCNKI